MCSFTVSLCYKPSICAHRSVLIYALARSHTYMAIAPVSDACMLAVYTDAGYLYIYVACRLHVFFTHTGSSGKGSIHSSVLYWSASELNKGTQPYSAPVCVNYTTFTAEPVLTTCWQLAGYSKFLAPPPPAIHLFVRICPLYQQVCWMTGHNPTLHHFMWTTPPQSWANVLTTC